MMDNNKNLYFIPIIAKAFDRPHPDESIHVAIDEISNLGKLDEYKYGYELFKKFVEEVIRSHAINKENKDKVFDNIITRIFSEDKDLLEEKSNILNMFKNSGMLNVRYEKLYQEYFKRIPLEIELYKEGSKVSSKPIEKYSTEIIFKEIKPGHYSINLSNGRMLWESEITKREIIWDDAFPGVSYPMAADSGEEKIQPTISKELVVGEIALSIFPGLETGMIVLKLSREVL
jgi:phenylpyruvate tautomerase PptA (4-oxalocrotonate tautomerase family)